MINLPKWNAEEWLYKFDNAKSMGNTRDIRMEVFQHTCDVVEEGQYISDEGKPVSLELNENAVEDNDYCEDWFCLTDQKRLEKTRIDVVESDCLVAARQMLMEDPTDDLCVLNMASPKNPGGGVFHGAGAQEEYLFRCSDYYRFLFQYARSFDSNFYYGIPRSQEHRYPFTNDNTGIFSHGVTVFRGPEDQGYPLVNDPWRVNMIAVAAFPLPEGLTRIPDSLVERTKERIRTIFRLAYQNGQRRLVLGAFGCGAFNNPPDHMANLFKEVLNEEEFVFIFRQIRFSILEDHNSSGENYSAFSNVFNC